jgi:signal transduction histidine kinase
MIDKGEQIQIQYLDDGIGFDLDETLGLKKGLGLFNLQNRIQYIGGKIDMYSKPEQGVNYQMIVTF